MSLLFFALCALAAPPPRPMDYPLDTSQVGVFDVDANSRQQPLMLFGQSSQCYKCTYLFLAELKASVQYLAIDGSFPYNFQVRGNSHASTATIFFSRLLFRA
jgi:hypothetical protein